MARKRKLKSVSLAQPQKEVPLDLRPNTILNPGQRVIGIEVDNPNKPDEKVIVWRSTRDWLFMDYAAGNIDEPQRLAGEHWRECYRLCEIGGSRATQIREYVDRTFFVNIEPISDKQMRASDDMKKAAKALSLLEGWLVRRILGDGLSPSQIAECLDGDKRWRTTAYYAQTFRAALQKLALAFTYS